MCVSAFQETVASAGACALQSKSWHLKEAVVLGTLLLLFLFMLTRPYSSALLDMIPASSCSLAGFQLTYFCTKSARNKQDKSVSVLAYFICNFQTFFTRKCLFSSSSVGPGIVSIA